MLLLALALAHAGLLDARPFGPVREVTVQHHPALPVPADLIAFDDRVWRLDRERILVLHTDGTLERLPLTGATLWLGPPGFPNLRRRGTPDPRLVVQQRGHSQVWDVSTQALDERVCGGDIDPYGWSKDCREIRFGEQRLTPAKYSRLAVSGGRLWVFGAGQVRIFDRGDTVPRLPGPIVHLSHDAETLIVGVPTGIRALDAASAETRWTLNRLSSWVAVRPQGDVTAVQTEGALLLIDRDGRIVYTVEPREDATFGWTASGDLVAATARATVRFDLTDSSPGRDPEPPPEARLAEGLVSAAVLVLTASNAPADIVSTEADGAAETGLPGAITVAAVDRSDLTTPADLDLVVRRKSTTERVRVLRPDPGEALPVKLAWKPMEVVLPECTTGCTTTLGPHLVGAEVTVSHEGARSDGSRATWTRTGVFLGGPWTLQPSPRVVDPYEPP